MAYVTRLASLDDYEKGGVEVIDDDPKNYAFSNIFEVASLAKPFEQIAVGKNFEYVLEASGSRGRPAGGRRRTTRARWCSTARWSSRCGPCATGRRCRTAGRSASPTRRRRP